MRAGDGRSLESPWPAGFQPQFTHHVGDHPDRHWVSGSVESGGDPAAAVGAPAVGEGLLHQGGDLLAADGLGSFDLAGPGIERRPGNS